LLQVNAGGQAGHKCSAGLLQFNAGGQAGHKLLLCPRQRAYFVLYNCTGQVAAMTQGVTPCKGAPYGAWGCTPWHDLRMPHCVCCHTVFIITFLHIPPPCRCCGGMQSACERYHAAWRDQQQQQWP
jgi:hypothetical protein